MRKRFTIFFCLIGMLCHAQSWDGDSLALLLKTVSAPIRRFDLINKILQDQVNNGTNIDTALCLEMVRLAQNQNNDSLLAIGYNMAGSYNARKGDYPTSLEYMFRALPLAEKYHDQRRISSLYFDISLVYIILDNLKEAYYYNLKGRDNLPDPSSRLYDFMASQFDRNMVRYYLLGNHPDSALPYLRHLETIGARLRTPVIRLPSLFLSGAAYGRLGIRDSAEHYFNAAVRFSDSIASMGLKWSNDRYFIPYLLAGGRSDEAKSRAFSLMKLGQAHDNPDVQLTAAGFLRIIYDKAHRADSAYYFSRVELSMKDSVFNENNLNKEQALAFNEKLRDIEAQREVDVRRKQRQQNLLLGVIALGVLFLTVAFVYQLRKRRREMDSKLASQRERISRELHDNVGSQLSYISGNLDWLIDSKSPLTSEIDIKKLALISETAKTVVSDLRETIWVIKKESIGLEELSDRLKLMLHDQLAVFPDIEMEVTENIKKNHHLLPAESLNAFRICQEAISNCLRHAQATKISLTIVSDLKKDYLFSVSDNGRGFDPLTKKEGHYGLEHMQERAKECGAELSIVSGPGQGTSVTIVKTS